MFMWVYDLWEYRQHRTSPLRQLELEVNYLKNELKKKDKQINNIYELLETLTNESKAKFNYLNESNKNVTQEADDEQTTTHSL